MLSLHRRNGFLPVSRGYSTLCTVINSSWRFDSNHLRSKYSRSPLLCQHLWSWGGGGWLAMALRPIAVLVLTGPNRIRTPACAARTTEGKWKKLWHRKVVVVIIHVCETDWIKVWHMQGLLGVCTCMQSSMWAYTYVGVVNVTSHPSSHSYMLFVFTVALWDTIA